MKKIVICGGNLTPALALTEELEKKGQIEIHFFGRKFSTEGSKNLSAEFKNLKTKKIKFWTVTSGRLQRKFTRYTIPSLFKVPQGFFQSFFYLLKLRPNLVVSFGGYLSPPVVFSAWLLGIDSITVEPAIIPGLATRINSLFVQKIFLSWPQSSTFFETGKTEVIGNLVRKSIFKGKIKNAQIDSFLKKSKNLLFITGGNQGSHFINQLILSSIPRLENFSILHQTGTANSLDFEKAKKVKRTNYMAVDYIDPSDFGTILNQVSIVISRSGANTVWEIALLAKPAIFIPRPIAAGNEQEENAKVLENAGSAVIIRQKDLTHKFLEETIKKVFKDLQKYKKSALAFSKTLPKDASVKLANCINKNFF